MGLFNKNNDEPEEMDKKLEEAKKFIFENKDTKLMVNSLEAREIVAAARLLHNDLEEIKSLLRNLQK